MVNVGLVSCLSRVRRKCAPWNAVLNPWRSQEELGGVFLGHRVYLKAKAGGEKSMPEKRGSLEDVKGAAPQGPRDRAKATLPEPQSPAVEVAHSPLRRLQRGATRGSLFNFRR